MLYPIKIVQYVQNMVRLCKSSRRVMLALQLISISSWNRTDASLFFLLNLCVSSGDLSRYASVKKARIIRLRMVFTHYKTCILCNLLYYIHWNEIVHEHEYNKKHSYCTHVCLVCILETDTTNLFLSVLETNCTAAHLANLESHVSRILSFSEKSQERRETNKKKWHSTKILLPMRSKILRIWTRYVT